MSDATDRLLEKARELGVEVDGPVPVNVVQPGVPEDACTQCSDPGRCCRAFPLGKVHPSGTDRRGVQQWLDSMGLSMFRPLRPMEPEPKGGHRWVHNCTALQEDGRCGIYLERPWTCKHYQPGTDWMCVWWKPEEHAPPPWREGEEAEHPLSGETLTDGKVW